MRSVILWGLATATWVSPVVAEHWVHLGTSVTAQDYFVDLDSVVSTPNTVTVWIKQPNFQPVGYPADSYMTYRMRLYCGVDEFEVLDLDVNAGDGRNLKSERGTKGPGGIPPGSFGDYLYTIVCKHVIPAK